MNTDITLPEIIEKMKDGQNRLERAEILQKYDNRRLREILILAFDHRIKFVDLPVPDYKPQHSEYGLTWSNLYKCLPRIRPLIDDGQPKNMVRLENLYGQILESIHPREAEILIQMVKGKWKEKLLTRHTVDLAFPNLLSPK